MLAGPSSQLSGLAFAVIVLATSTVLVAGLAWVSRRLLGLPVGALRALIAGLLGFVAALLLGRSLRAAQPGHLVAFVTVVLGIPLIVAMLFIVMAEVLVPSGTLPQPLEMLRGTRNGARALAAVRADQPDRGAARPGPLPARAAGPQRRRGRRPGSTGAVAAPGPGRGGVTFTKLGQLLSTRSDLLPPEFTTELAKLQDRAEPAPWAQVAEVIAESLGSAPEEVFAELADRTCRGRIDRPGTQGTAALRDRSGRRGGGEGPAPRNPHRRGTGPGHPAAPGGPARGSCPLGACGRHGRRRPWVRRGHQGRTGLPRSRHAT